MPRPVVPIFVPLAAFVFAHPSSSPCRDRMSAVFSAIFRRSGVTSTPCAPSFSISATKACGSKTTPLPMIDSLPAHHAGRQQRQLVDLAVDDQRVAGIVAALEAHHDVGALRQPVDDLALAFVAPLRADDHHIGHASSLRSLQSRRRPKRQASIAASLGAARHFFAGRRVAGRHNNLRRSSHLLGRQPIGGRTLTPAPPSCIEPPISCSC